MSGYHLLRSIVALALLGGLPCVGGATTPNPRPTESVLMPTEPGTGFGMVVAGAGDVNGDGYADVLVGGLTEADERGAAWLFLGSPQGVKTNAAWTAQGPHPGSQFGSDVAPLGDVNRDGFADFGIGAPRFRATHDRQGAAYVYFGAKAGPSSGPDWTFLGEYEGAFVGGTVTAAGDVNGDGFDDVLVSGNNYGAAAPAAGFVMVFHGSAGGLPSRPNWVTRGDQLSGSFGVAARAAGDVNRDGFDDVLIGEPNRNEEFSNQGRVYLFLGSANGLALQPAWATTYRPKDLTLVQLDYQLFGNVIGGAGDLNGDGWPDIFVAAYHATRGELHEGRVFVFHGSPAGFPESPSWSVEANQAHARLGTSAASAGDVNGDGFPDLVVGAMVADRHFPDEGFAGVFYGSKKGLPSEPNWTREGAQRTAYLGQSVAGAGDVNGDGFADVLVAAHGREREGKRWGAVTVHYGGPGGLANSSQWRLRKTWFEKAQTKLNNLMSRTGWVVVSMGGALICGTSILVVVLRRRQVATRDELARQRRAAEEERRRLARDLHDEVGSQLARLAALSQTADRSETGGPHSQLTDSMAKTALDAIRAIDEMVWTVKPGQDHLPALADFLSDYAPRFFAGTPVGVGLDIPLDLPDTPISPVQRRNILAIVKEALTNVLKHAGASRVTVSLRYEDPLLIITIQDDGRGFSRAEIESTGDTGADGLTNMEERAAESGASLEIQTRPAGGTSIFLRVPIPQSSSHSRTHAHIHRLR